MMPITSRGNLLLYLVPAAALGACYGSAQAATLKPKTEEAFERYIRAAESRIQNRTSGRSTFLWSDDSPERRERVRRGEVVVEVVGSRDSSGVPDGLVHDWVGAVFIPGVTLSRTVVFMKDYNNNKNVYKPEVIDSRILSHSGNDYKVYLRLLKKKVITVVLDTEHDVRYFTLDAHRAYSRSYSTRISEVEDPGTSRERVLPLGEDHGFLWRLNSYWRFEERDGGVYVECEAISLTRDVPLGLNKLIGPIIDALPRESLVQTLRNSRTGLAP